MLDEFKTHLRGGQIVLRSKTPELIEQEFYGLMLAHRAVRTLMNEAAQHQNIDPDRLSFTHSLRVIRRKWPGCDAAPFPLRICRSGWRACAVKSFKYASRSEKAASARGA